MHHDTRRKITPIEEKMTKELVLMLKPFEEATQTVEGENMVTISASCPIIIVLKVRHNVLNIRTCIYIQVPHIVKDTWFYF